MKRFAMCAVAVCVLFLSVGAARAACVDNVVLVHGNTGKPADFDNTVAELQRRGYTSSQIFRPNWGSKTCAACNDHSGSEETPVESAIIDAIALSCTGKIDVNHPTVRARSAPGTTCSSRPCPSRLINVSGLSMPRSMRQRTIASAKAVNNPSSTLP